MEKIISDIRAELPSLKGKGLPEQIALGIIDALEGILEGGPKLLLELAGRFR